MPDDAPQTGQRAVVPVMRYLVQGEGHIYSDEIGQYGEPGIWLSLDADAHRERLETTAIILNGFRDDEFPSYMSAAAAVLSALGLTPPEPKEGGAA